MGQSRFGFNFTPTIFGYMKLVITFFSLSQNWGKFSSTAEVLRNISNKKCLELAQYKKSNPILEKNQLSKHKKLYNYTSFLWEFMQPKMCACD
jgi:hypothetical protein